MVVSASSARPTIFHVASGAIIIAKELIDILHAKATGLGLLFILHEDVLAHANNKLVASIVEEVFLVGL